MINWIPACGRCEDCRNRQVHLCMGFMENLFSKHRFEIDGTPARQLDGTVETWLLLMRSSVSTRCRPRQRVSRLCAHATRCLRPRTTRTSPTASSTTWRL
nr:molecular chaperone GroES [Streptomyces sp.]